MHCKYCYREMDVILDENFGKEWHCPFCKKLILRDFNKGTTREEDDDSRYHQC